MLTSFMMRSIVFSVGLLVGTGQPPPAQTPPAQTPPAQTPPGQTPPAQTPPVPAVKETVVVSASKTEQQLVNAPATMTVIDAGAIAGSSATSFADVLRSVPGLNVTQLSSRDINVTSRAATGSLATSELTLLDGRTLYQDFFGFTAWDFMPVNMDEIKRIEVVRGPASAVWGANAMSGVINVITKTPRESQGTTFTMGIGSFPRTVFGHAAKSGSLFYLNGSHAEALNDRWAYKVSAGGLVQDPFPRPTGVIPGSATFQSYPAYGNPRSTQPKVDARFDYDFPDKVKTMSFSGGYAGTTGIMQTGIGPFSIDSGSGMGYAKFAFSRRALHLQAFGNFQNTDARNLLTVGTTGQPIVSGFNTKTYDVEFGDTVVAGAKNAVTYGGNVRLNQFHLTIAPGETQRTEGGGYVQDEFSANAHVRVVVGARADKFSSISSAVFSPRVALLLKPQEAHTFRLSYNRAFRAPSMVNNNLNISIATPVPLSTFGLPGTFYVPTDAVGNPGLTEEHVDAAEFGYTGVFRKRTTVSAAVYYSRLRNQILFTETKEWSTSTPPAGWPLPALFWGAVQASAHIPQTFTYLNFGEERNKGLELGIDTVLVGGAALFANYSYQSDPQVNFDPLETNHPARHRFNAGVSYTDDHLISSLSVASSSSAYWQDVLDARFHGTTPNWVVVNGSFGVKFGIDGRWHALVKGTNLLNREVQQHIFGDVIKRQLIAELQIFLK